MPSTRPFPYDLNFKLKIIAETEVVDNNYEIARKYGISESMVWEWRRQRNVLFSGELKMTAKRATIGPHGLYSKVSDCLKSQCCRGCRFPCSKRARQTDNVWNKHWLIEIFLIQNFWTTYQTLNRGWVDTCHCGRALQHVNSQSKQRFDCEKNCRIFRCFLACATNRSNVILIFFLFFHFLLSYIFP